MRHIIAILLQNEAGALARVAGLFSTRGYNIESLSVAPTDDPTVSRLTLVTSGSDAVIQQIANQLNKLVDVVNVLDMTRGEHLERELVLLKLKVAAGQSDVVRGQVVRSGGRVLDPAMDGFIVELTASEAEVSGFVEELANERSCSRWCAAGRSASAATSGRCGRARRRSPAEGARLTALDFCKESPARSPPQQPRRGAHDPMARVSRTAEPAAPRRAPRIPHLPGGCQTRSFRRTTA